MAAENTTSFTPGDMALLIWSQRRLWLGTTLVCGVLAAAYSLVMPRYWEASQGLLVRQETAGSSASRPGKFADLYEMRTLQETILELAKSQQVVVATIENVERAETGAHAEPPTLEDIEEFRKHLKMLPPDGGEFGKTEVFYFNFKAVGREHAIRLVGELCRQLETALKRLRAHRAASLIAELEEQTKLAAELLAEETQRLMQFETKVGVDLGELRMLHSANSGQSDLRMESVQLESDVRKFRTQVREAEKLLALLRAAQQDPQQLIATPNSLLSTQPALRRLKDGLIDATLATSRLGGTRSPDHPRVRAAIEAERQIRADLHDELVTAIRGAEVELQLGRDRLAACETRLEDLQKRFTHLAELRAEYSNRVAALENCRLTVDRARQDLNIAKAAEAAAHSGTLVTRLDEPETGPYPAGPGRTVITGAGLTAGLMLGLGLVFLTSSAPSSVETTSADSIASRVEPRVVRVPVAVAPEHPQAERPATTWTDALSVELEDVAVAASQPHVDRPLDAPRKRWTPRPAVVEPLPSMAPVDAYAGMSLQEALQAAAKHVPV